MFAPTLHTINMLNILNQWFLLMHTLNAAHLQCCTPSTLHKQFQCTLSLHLLRSAHSAHIKFCTHSMHITINSAHSGQNQWCTICKHTLWHTSSLLWVHYGLSIKGTLQCLIVPRTLLVQCLRCSLFPTHTFWNWIQNFIYFLFFGPIPVTFSAK